MKKSLLLLIFLFLFCGSKKDSQSFMNVSYDPTREFYRDYNEAFLRHYRKTHPNIQVHFKQSHGGSGKQARAVIDGLEADVVTLALAKDISAIAEKTQKIPADWQKKRNHNSAPYASTIVFVVRNGNPKNIRDWDDLAKPGIAVITPNPKTSGGAQWNYLAAWAFALKKFNKNEAKTREFLKAIYQNVAVLDSGARGSTTTFSQRKMGDVYISWENEAFLMQKEFPSDKYEIIVPSLSILAEPTVAVVEGNAQKKGNAEIAKAYLDYLESDEGQMLAAKHYYRPRNAKIAAQYPYFKKLNLITIDNTFGGWPEAHKKHFADGGTFDQIYDKPRK